MKTKLRAAVGSLLVSAAVAGAAVMPAASSAHGNTGPLCWENENYTMMMYTYGGVGGAWGYLNYGEAFRIKETIVFAGEFWSLGHSAATYPADYWVSTGTLRCDHPPA